VWETDSLVRESAELKAPLLAPDEVRGIEIATPEIVTDCGSAKAMVHVSFVGLSVDG